MKIFFGAAIQGHQTWGERSGVYRQILTTLRQLGHQTYSEHTMGKSREEAMALMNVAIGPLPTTVAERLIYVRDKMIAGVDGDIDAAIFEVSTPSLGTGVELTHAYLRPERGLRSVPILALYQEGYWPHNLSTMIRGITPEKAPQFKLQEYRGADELTTIVQDFLQPYLQA